MFEKPFIPVVSTLCCHWGGPINGYCYGPVDQWWLGIHNCDTSFYGKDQIYLEGYCQQHHLRLDRDPGEWDWKVISEAEAAIYIITEE